MWLGAVACSLRTGERVRKSVQREKKRDGPGAVYPCGFGGFFSDLFLAVLQGLFLVATAGATFCASVWAQHGGFPL